LGEVEAATVCTDGVSGQDKGEVFVGQAIELELAIFFGCVIRWLRSLVHFFSEMVFNHLTWFALNVFWTENQRILLVGLRFDAVSCTIFIQFFKAEAVLVGKLLDVVFPQEITHLGRLSKYTAQEGENIYHFNKVINYN